MKRQFGLVNVKHHPRSVVTVGTFDGVHAGHQQILGRVQERAAAQGAESTLLTFDPHPREVLRDAPMPLLTTVEERGDLLDAVGVDRFVVLPFTERFSQMSPEAYVRDILVNRIGLVEIIVGYDHSFGHKGAGDGDTLRRLGAEYGFAVEIISKQVVDRAKVSSTRIRELVGSTGDVAEAQRLLTRPYRLSGTVVKGEQRGRTIGFPTANLDDIPPRKIIPKRGVYAAWVTGAAQPSEAVIASNQPAMVNIGYRPTFDGKEKTVEAHLLDFSGDLYGKQLGLHFLERIRDEHSFEGPEALIAQLNKDRSVCEGIFSNYGF